MTRVLELPPDLQARLAAEAEQHGKAVEEWALSLYTCTVLRYIAIGAAIALQGSCLLD